MADQPTPTLPQNYGNGAGPEAAPAHRMPLVQGLCPACGRNCLFLASGGYVTCSYATCPEPDAASSLLEQREKRVPDDAQMEVFKRAHAIYLEREARYAETWREYGARGSIVHLRTCVTRAWRQLWAGRTSKLDNLLDAINYAAFTVRNLESDNLDGTWGYE